jgi:hypothetical protein
MNGMTRKEMVEFKRIQSASRAVRNVEDIKAMKRMASEFVKSAASTTARVRRRMAMDAVRFVNSHFND